MYRFEWHTPTSTPREIVLEIHSRTSWFGRKTLHLDGEIIFNRGSFQGIEQRLSLPGISEAIWMRMVPIAGTPSWRPALFLGETELPERTGTEPPKLVERPKVLGVTVGVAYLVMLMAVVMLPSIVKILGAVHRDSIPDYSATQDVVPWVFPGLVTAVCLLGYWNMRKWGVYLYAPAVAVQGLLWITSALPISTTAMLLQVVLCFMGVVYLSRMQ